MIELIIVLGALVVIFLAAACALASRCNSLYDEIKKLEASNAYLKCSVRALKSENDRMQNRVYVTTDTHQVARLKLSLRLREEQIDDLKTKLDRQQQLLQQKWEGSKK